MPVSAVILAGGRGERLGRDKANVALEGKTLLQRAQDVAARLSDDIIVVLRPDQCLRVNGARVITDIEPYGGVMAGIAAGLVAAQHEWSFVAACDMPFINLDLVHYMISLRQDVDVVVPRLDVGFEPLHALYHKRCLAALCSSLEKGQCRVVSFYKSLNVRTVAPSEMSRFDPDGRSFYNINTPEDLVQARAWLEACPKL